jgi:pyruvate formate lyase activating enzyme
MRLVGREVAVADLVPELVRDRPFFEASGGGVTLTGGEPTAQFDAMLDLLAALRAVGIHTAVETCGHFTPARVTDLADATDLLLFDLKHAEAAIHEAATGVGLEVIRANFIGLLERMGAGRLVARVPLIGGFNTGSDEVAALAAWLVETCGYGGEVHLLPGHGWARHKYETLGRGAAYRPVTPPGPGDRLRIETTLTDRGLIPVWGG